MRSSPKPWLATLLAPFLPLTALAHHSVAFYSTDKIELVVRVEARVTCIFSDLALVKARLATAPGVRLDNERFFETGAELAVALPESAADAIARMLIDITAGRATVDFDA